MKKIILLNLLLFFFCLSLFGQSDRKAKQINLVQAEHVQELVDASQKIYPDGIVHFKPGTTQTPAEIISLLGVEKGVTFEVERENVSRFDPTVVFKRYQQYYKGIPVETGGYTVKVNKASDRVQLFSPRIFYNIDVDVSSAKAVQDCLNDKQKKEFVQSELIISNVYTTEFRLLHKVYCFDTESEIFWIDAHTQEVVNYVKKDIHLTGNTPTYGSQSLNDDPQGTTTYLQNPDQSVRVYETWFPMTKPVVPSEWLEIFIPTTENTTSWGNDADPKAQQALFVADQVAPLFNNVGIDFGTVHIEHNEEFFNSASAFEGSTVENAYISLGSFFGAPVALYDVIGHELGHCFLMQFLDYTDSENNEALHEGISDILGTYVESFVQGTDWLMGDDEWLVAAFVGRDLAEQVCETDLQGADGHDRGLVMGHWFYSIVNGIPDDGIPAIGMQTSADIVIEALNNLNNPNAGYPEMRTQTLLAAELIFGSCSEEYEAVVKAWDRVCVTGHSNWPTPLYHYVDGTGNPKTEFCEHETVYMDGSASFEEYRYFLGIWQYEIGGWANDEPNVGYSRTEPWWVPGEVGDMVNLTDIWANFEQDYFEAGYEYKVQLAVQGPCDPYGWNVKSDELFTVVKPTPDYVTVNSLGQPTKQFCFGETVYLNGSASMHENEYFLSLWKYEFGGWANQEPHLAYSRTEPWWVPGEVGSMVNLNDIWANFQQEFFEPGYEYRIQLAVRGECDPTGWNVKEDRLFSVVCCKEPETCDAKYTVSMEEDQAGNLYFSFNHDNQSYYDHFWSVVSHENQSEGPYTLVTESTDPDFEFVGSIGGCYTILHEVTTPCGTCCYTREVCNEKMLGDTESSSTEQDCNKFCELRTPTSLYCYTDSKGYLNLNWADVTGAVGYIVTIQMNDPYCCPDAIPGNSYELQTVESTVELQFFPICMSWSVTAICEKGNSLPSEKACFSYKTGCKAVGDGHIATQNRLAAPSSELEVYPNPSNGVLNYSISLAAEDSVEEIVLLDLSGKVVESIVPTATTGRQVTGTHYVRNESSGLYLMQVRLKSGILTQRVMIAK